MHARYCMAYGRVSAKKAPNVVFLQPSGLPAPDWSIVEMYGCMKGLINDKAKIVLSACTKRKESKTISKIAEDLRKKPDTVRGWPARERGGLHDLADHKPRFSDKLGGLHELMTYFSPHENRTKNASRAVWPYNFPKQEPGGRGPPIPCRLARPVRGTR